MKLNRLWPPVLAALAVLVNACSTQQDADASGLWAAAIDVGGATVPVGFGVTDDNHVADINFQLYYDGYFLDYEVTAYVQGDRFFLDAHASGSPGSVTLEVRARVNGDAMSGTYDFISVPTSGETVHASGAFTAVRTADQLDVVQRAARGLSFTAGRQALSRPLTIYATTRVFWETASSSACLASSACRRLGNLTRNSPLDSPGRWSQQCTGCMTRPLGSSGPSRYWRNLSGSERWRPFIMTWPPPARIARMLATSRLPSTTVPHVRGDYLISRTASASVTGPSPPAWGLPE